MRLLKALVIGMGVLILAGIALLAWGLTHRGTPGAGAPAPPVAAMPGDEPSYIAVQVPAPEGMKFEQMAATADRVLLRFAGPEGGRIVVIDPKTGRVSGTIDVAPAGK